MCDNDFCVNDDLLLYVERHIGDDTAKLLLKDEPALSFSKSFAITQIECRRRCRDKIPELLGHRAFVFPTALSAEQCTHQEVARFHASLFGKTNRVVDMTMGLGVDTHYIAGQARSVTAIEMNPYVAAAGKHNMTLLHDNVTVVCGDSTALLVSLPQCDAIFIDPARRDTAGKRLYGLSDCVPDVVAMLPLLSQKCRRLVIKASPMLDVTKSVADLGEHLQRLWAVSVRNECKELLFELDFMKTFESPTLCALNYDGRQWSRFSPTPSSTGDDEFSAPIAGGYIYEPNASIMKLQCFSSLAQHYGLRRIAQNSHLMTGDALIADFPGRKFSVVEVMEFTSRIAKTFARRYPKINITTRNFRLSASQLRAKLRVADGGDLYLLATTTQAGQAILVIATYS